ncbi:MAG: polymerase subunit delta [Alphaproteobacteria bacterium]|jgi:DNA polymerase-3 subunit delta'|nr:polymerase subunit delta [Alphaproteobacteria bacterium]MDF3033126.1 polymerase subunit delta [Alphaproteobacteria bacterium]
MHAVINPDLHPKCQTILAGHQSAHGRLQQAFRNKTMHPVWLLAGERGIGKSTLAYTMAREILADGGQDPTFVARQMIQGTYPNFLALERCLNDEGKVPREINAEEGRKVSTFLSQCAAIPGWRVIIIDAVDEMNRTAANALLKVLEEPPAKTIFFLIAHSLGQVLPTIRSRCCKLQLFPLTDMEIAPHLAGISPEILPLARGSIGRLMALQKAGGIKLLEQVIQAIGGALKGDWRPAQALSALFGKDNPGYETMLDLVIWALHHLIILAHLPMPNTPANEKLSPLIKLKSMAHWVDALHCIHHFLEIARTSHLDRSHIVMAIFFMIENPTAGDTFIYDTL